MKEKIERVRSLRRAYQSNGYIPVAVHNPVTGDKKSGKNPVGTGWQKQVVNTPITAEPSALNTGILLPDLYAIDQDTDDKELSEEVAALIVKHVGSKALSVRLSNWRATAFFREESHTAAF